MDRTTYNWKRFILLPCLIGTLFILLIANQNGILPHAYSVTSMAANTTATPNSSSQAGVIIITKNDKGNLIFKPQTLTIKPGEEIFIGNNDTSPHSIINGISSSDPLSGKLFDTGLINPKGYAEFVASNLNPGKYPYYSIKDPSLKGEIIVMSQK